METIYLTLINLTLINLTLENIKGLLHKHSHRYYHKQRTTP
jgi:hypothetical protein